MTTPEKKPWEIIPAFTLDLLSRIRALVWEVQLSVAATMDWKNGEDLWVAGCKAYKQRVHALSLAAKAEYADWLSVGFIEGQFVFRIHGIPIRVYRPPADGEVPDRYVHPTEGEVLLLNGAYQLFDLPSPDRVWRLEVPSDRKARPIDVILVQVDAKGQRYDAFVIPAPIQVVLNADSEESFSPPQRTTKPRKRPIVLPEAEVTSRREREARSPNAGAEGTGA